jgi:hypothetical protein
MRLRSIPGCTCLAPVERLFTVPATTLLIS